MPSGLTWEIYEGRDMTLRHFALKCLRQLGAGYHASNGGEKALPLDKAPVIPVSDYHIKQLEKAKHDVSHWLEVEKNPEKLDKLYNEYLETRERENIKCSTSNSELKARYLTMKAKVEAWNLPEEYASLKELMLKQLNESIDFDCRERLPYESSIPTKEEWLKIKLSSACRDVDYHTKEYEKEVKHIAELNEYLRGVYDAIDKVEPL